MNTTLLLASLVGKKIIGFGCGNDDYYFQLDFDDGSKLEVTIKASCCDDAWFDFEYKKAPISEG